MFNLKNHNKNILIIILFSALPVHANTFGDADISIISDDNITRSDYGPDKKSDTAIETFVDYGKFYDLNDNWSATTSVFASYVHYSDFDKLSGIGYGVSGSIRKKLGLGAYASSLNFSLSIDINDIDDDKRDNTTIEANFGWAKRLNDIWELAAGITLDDSDADNNVFDVSGNTIYFNADYTISEKLLLSLGISQRSGDIITVTNPSTNPTENFWGYLTLASGGNNIVDTVFGTGLTAYRVDADTLILKASLSYAINDNSSMNFGYELQNSELAYGIDYENNIVHVNYIYSF